MAEAIAKILELLPRYAWVGVVVIAAIFLLPDQLASELSISKIRTTYEGWLWIGMATCSLIWVGSLVPAARKLLSKYIVVPAAKIFRPYVCIKTGLVQSRMRYALHKIGSANGKIELAYCVTDSNGEHHGYCNERGQECVPPVVRTESAFDNNGLIFPIWGRIDWKDVFDGDPNTGRWPIEVPRKKPLFRKFG